MDEQSSFSAIRISLASPERILSWSYGEVTKPETINYRNQKPEKDGLFCERIFGPTKDFECFCGKYKRIRYRGVICDRCGVEVTRSKVRRERMGHIRLAAPVAHIWFTKGTPSWMGLLLDLSPRSLERVLYFAQYIITKVDDKAKQDRLDTLQKEMDDEIGLIDKKQAEEVGNVQRAVAEATANLDAREKQKRAPIEADWGKAKTQAQDVVDALKARLKSLEGKKAPESFALGDTPIIAKGETVEESHQALVDNAVPLYLEGVEESFAERRRDVEAEISSERDHLNQSAAQEANRLMKDYGDQKETLRKEWTERQADLEALKPLQILSEARFRELYDKYKEVFTASMGAEAVLEVLHGLEMDKLHEDLILEIQSSSGQRSKKAAKRLRVVDALRKSSNKPDWMVLTVLPVLPPDLRPMVQLDGGRFATSDLNDLYRRVINRNNRLKRLMNLGAPEIIVRNEKRMLQEAVDALIDNGRRGRALTGSHNHKLKSLSDMLRGKQGRFRQNLLGKRVDYSGRSVIVVGPNLRLDQCGLPKRMALELFKPFVMYKLVAKGLAHNIKSAKRMVDRVRPEVWDILEEVIQGRTVLLNRAPTLHRLSIQAFYPVLVEGSAIQIHPLVCSAFNADFDGDQMAVHVPVGKAAVEESKAVMLSTHNMLLPSSGEPVVSPTLDIVVGCYYLTMLKKDVKGIGNHYHDFDDAKLAYDLGQIALHAEIDVVRGKNGERVKTTVGRIIFNDVLTPEMDYENRVIDKAALKDVTIKAYNKLGNLVTADILDRMKNMGFHYATQSGLTIALNDIITPLEKPALMAEADAKIAAIDQEYQEGLITDDERDKQVIGVWTEVNDRITGIINRNLPSYGNLHLMAGSGAKGSIAQIKQMAGMRGLMADPQGKIIPLPIKSNFREGLTVMEYFISTHGARKGLADTALRTADSGYLTRRLIDVAQDVIVMDHDCGSPYGVTVGITHDPTLPSFKERLLGRVAAAPIVHPTTGEVLAVYNQEIDEKVVNTVLAANVQTALVRSPLTCEAPRGICQLCYGRSLARGRLVSKGEAVGIIAAQSIGEPGTQLTMRTFHTGGIVGRDITSGLPRVEEIFEARIPKGVVPLAESDGVVEVIGSGDNQRIKIISMETYTEDYKLPEGFAWVVEDNETVEPGAELARPENEDGEDLPDSKPVRARIPGRVMLSDTGVTLFHEEQDEREYPIPAGVRVLVETGHRVKAGDPLADGLLNPQDILRIKGREAVERYLTNEVQRVYRSQGVNIHDKHVEIIVRQMLRRVIIEYAGDTDFGQDEFVDRFLFEAVNASVIAQGGEPATARPILLGVTKASLNTESFLAAASFQETTRILTQDALMGKVDFLRGLKENVILGRLIPARYEFAEAELQRIRASSEVKLFRRTEEDEFGGIAVLPAEAELGDQENGAFGDHNGHMEEAEPADDELLKGETEDEAE